MPQRLIACLIFVIIVVMDAAAQEATTSTEQPEKSVVTSTASTTLYADSHETREALQNLLSKYPPQVGRVLKLDPALFSNQAYLANYPGLAAFVSQHPEIAHTPAFYLESIWVPNDSRPESTSERIWRETLEGVAIFMVMLLVTGSFVWLIRTLIEHRRWSRLTRTQAEVHGKLMDRLGSNAELLAYMQTPGGKRFLESAPIALDAGPRAVSVPIGRILWSIQAGLILAAAGFGMMVVSRGVEKSAGQPLLAMGTLGVAIGGGFLLSAFVSFVLSKRLGLLGPAASSETSDAPALSE
ncbi:MAG: hypothetical protein M3P06_19805 [Acidobacteriota bacterium]|nr:hypothetical protein [Acidobacteriota bacterium]